MLNRKLGFFILTDVVWLGTPASVLSAKLDFDSVLVCKLDYLQVCEDIDPSCDRVEVVHVDGVQSIQVDPKKMQLTTYLDKEIISTAKIDKINHAEHKVYFHGVNPDSPIAVNGTGWVAKVGKETGNFSAAVLADVTGYLVFGTCRNQ